MTRRTIIAVDDSSTNLISCKKVLRDTYEVFTVPSAQKMFELLEQVIPDLILLDVQMPVMNGYEAIRILKDTEAYKDIPVIFLSAMDDAESEIEGLNLGAVDYIHKPFVGALLIKRIESHMAVVDAKKEMQNLKRSVNKLRDDSTVADADSEVVKALLSETSFLFKMDQTMHRSIMTVIELIESAIKSEDVTKIKQYLGDADVEARMILEIIDGTLET